MTGGLLVDLYDTAIEADWSTLSALLRERFGTDDAGLRHAFQFTRIARGTGHYGSIAGNLRALAAACNRPLDDDAGARLAADLVAAMRASVHLYPDVVPVLRRLRAAGTRVALVSNCDHATRPVIEALGLGAEVDAVVLSCEVASLKPDRRIFDEALGRLGVTAGASRFVDDQSLYLDGAAALGLRTFRIVRDPAFPDPAASPAHVVITSFDELP